MSVTPGCPGDPVSGSLTGVSRRRPVGYRVAMAGLDVPMYRQIAADVERRVRTGQWPVGTRIPSEADLITLYGCSREEVRRAVRLLRASGMVQVCPGSGMFASERRTG